MSAFVQQVVYALNAGSIYALYALGVGLLFGILRLLNFAHAGLITAGGYCLVLTDGAPLPVRIAVTVGVCVALSLLLDLLVFRQLRGASPATLLIVSFGVSVALAGVAEMAFGSLGRSTDLAPAFSRSWELGTVTIKAGSVVNIVVAAVLLIALVAFLNGTRAGISMRGAAEDFRTARLLGVRANRVIALAFAISGVLAAAAAVLLVGSKELVTPDFGMNPLLFGFIAAVLGGLTSLKGAVLGGYALGIAGQILQTVLPVDIRPFRDAVLFVGVFLLLVLRPQGLVGSQQGVRV